MTPKQRVLKVYPGAYCYRLNPRGGVFAVIAPRTRAGNEIIATHISHVEAWKMAAKRLRV